MRSGSTVRSLLSWTKRSSGRAATRAESPLLLLKRASPMWPSSRLLRTTRESGLVYRADARTRRRKSRQSTRGTGSSRSPEATIASSRRVWPRCLGKRRMRIAPISTRPRRYRMLWAFIAAVTPGRRLRRPGRPFAYGAGAAPEGHVACPGGYARSPSKAISPLAIVMRMVAAAMQSSGSSNRFSRITVRSA